MPSIIMGVLGALAGAVIGFALSGSSSVLPSAVLGGCVGIVLGVRRSPWQSTDAASAERTHNLGLEAKVDHLYRCLADVHKRLAALEGTATQVSAADTAAISSAATVATVPFVAEHVEPLPQIADEMPPPRVDAVDTTDLPSLEPADVALPQASTSTPPLSGLPRWLTGGNTLVRVGVALLFFGVAFLLKYAADHSLIPVELRLAGVALGGVALLVVGWRLRARRAGYALVLQGGGIGVLYLAVFAALRLYHLVPPAFAFALLAAIAVLAAMLAILQDARALAITGAIGGFLAPILTSTGSGSHVALFSFYAVLNAGICAIAWRKAWRELNLVGFGFTFATGLAWGVNAYRPELFASTEPFLILFFLMYVAVAVLFASRQAPRLVHYVDGTLVFGVPVAAFGLQAAMVHDRPFATAFSALALGAFYLLLALALQRRQRATLRLLVESFLALGVGFTTLAVPLAFDGRLTSAVWAVEGAAILWIGVRQQRVLARVFGVLLQLGAGAAFVADTRSLGSGVPVLNSLYLGSVMIAVATLFSSFYLTAHRTRVSAAEGVAAHFLFAWGALWWFASGLSEIGRQVPAGWGPHPAVLFAAGSCALFGILWRRLQWRDARYVALASVPLAALIVAVSFFPGFDVRTHPFAHRLYLGWAAVFAVHLWTLHSSRAETLAGTRWLHAAGVWLLVAVLSWELAWQIDRYVEGLPVWPLIAWAVVPGAVLLLLAARGERLGWPVAAHRLAYLGLGGAPLVVFLVAWVLWVNVGSDGDPAPLPYVPLLNPLDLAQTGALLAVISWFVSLRRRAPAVLPPPGVALRLLAVLVFVALNGVLLRALHYYAGVPYEWSALMNSVVVQSALSLFWSLLALAAMVSATRYGQRMLWASGAALLGVVVCKLFLVDLSNSGTVERVVSFIGVGLLVILIGYFAPVPPKGEAQPA